MTKNSKINTVTSPDYHRWTLYLLLGLGLVRLIGLYFSPLNLHGDEAQYWAWSRELDWGYFSKPPMIAWVIAATTSIFGNAEWAVRISSPLIHPLIAYILFRTARFLYDARTGFWTACAYFLMPAVSLSSGIVSTDVTLLLFWALGLNAFFHLRQTPSMKWALLLGMAIGFGMLSKYAMLFFLPALVLAIFIDEKTRRALLCWHGIAVALVSLAVLSPNIWWNVRNDFSTISHTAANANLKGIPFHPLELLEFWGSQIGVFGPIMLGLLVMALITGLRGRLERKTLLLSLFVLTPLAVISLEALLSRANANWAVTAYAGGAILVARTGVLYFKRATKIGVWVNIVMGSVLAFGTLVPSFANMVGQANAFKRLRGWPQTQALIAQAANAGHKGQAFSTIATDNRLVFYDMIYYGLEQNTGLPMRMWRLNTSVNNHAEANVPLETSKVTDPPVLMINYYMGYEDKFRDDFKRLEFIDTIKIDLGGAKQRTLKLWAGYGYTPTDDAGRK